MNFEKDPLLCRKDLELEEAWAFQFQDQVENDNIEEKEKYTNGKTNEVD